MASMRRVTRKPPKILTAAMKMPSAAKTGDQGRGLDPICISAPRMMIDEIALVTAISGVCRRVGDVPDHLEADEDRQHEHDEMLHEAGRRDQANTQDQRGADGQKGHLVTWSAL